MKRRLLQVLLVLIVAAVPAYIWLFVESGTPTQTFTIDVPKLRALANSIAGDKPTQVRVERMMSMEGIPSSAIVAGSGFTSKTLTMYAYQVVYPQSTGIIDTGCRDTTNPTFDEAAQKRVYDAMLKASYIVVTHEHFDHIGGLATHPELSKVLPHALLSAAQLKVPKNMDPVSFPPGALDGYKALEYEGAYAVAPGVVLLKAPGHTVGSQLVFVQQADGRELLFLGDVAWLNANVEQVRERARLVTLMMNEDRQAVLAQLSALHELREKEPKIQQVPGHDAAELERLMTSGVLTRGFE